MGFWQKTTVEINKALADGATSVTIEIPNANRLGEVSWMLHGTGGAGTPACEGLITRAELTANGVSSIIDLTNVQARDISQMRNRGIRSEVLNTTSGATRVTTKVLMGRFKHDPEVILPAYRFNTLKLKLTFDTLIATTAFATGTVQLDVFVDELVVDEDDLEDEEIFIQKIAEIETFTAGTTGDKKVKLALGHLLAAIYMRAAGTDGTTISKFKVLLNNGAFTPIAETWLNSQSDDMVEYGLVGASGAAKLANVTMVDFDNPATEQIMDEVIDLGVDSGINSADLEVTQGAAQVVQIVQISYIPVAEI